MKIRITKRGCFGRINKEVKELEIGYEMEVKEIPPAFNDRCMIISEEKKKDK